MSEQQVLPQDVTGIKPLALDQITPEIRLMASRCILAAGEEGGTFSRDAHKYAAYTIIRERQLRTTLSHLEDAKDIIQRMMKSQATAEETIAALRASLAQSEAERERLQGELAKVRDVANFWLDAHARERERNQEARATNERLTSAIYWALGYEEFRQRGPKEGAYWWRTELRSRALLADRAEPAPVVTGEK